MTTTTASRTEADGLRAVIEEQEARAADAESRILEARRELTALGPRPDPADLSVVRVKANRAERDLTAAQRFLVGPLGNSGARAELHRLEHREQTLRIPIRDLETTLTEARAHETEARNTTAAQEQRRQAAITAGDPHELADANLQLRDLTSALLFARRAVLEAELPVHDHRLIEAETAVHDADGHLEATKVALTEATAEHHRAQRDASAAKIRVEQHAKRANATRNALDTVITQIGNHLA